MWFWIFTFVQRILFLVYLRVNVPRNSLVHTHVTLVDCRNDKQPRARHELVNLGDGELPLIAVNLGDGELPLIAVGANSL